MDKRYFSIVALIFMLISCKETNYIKYYQYINEARYYFFNQDYKNARIYFENGFKKVEKHYDLDEMFYAACLYEEGEEKRAIEILETNSTTLMGTNSRHYFRDMPQEVKDSIITINNKYVNDSIMPLINSDLFQEIERRLKEDRIVRDKYREASNKGTDSLILQLIVDTMEMVDLNNRFFLDSVYLKHGFLGGVNWIAPRQTHVFLLHASQEWFWKNKRFLYKALKKGHILPVDYASVIDRKQYAENNKPSYYFRWGGGNDSLPSPKEFFKRCNKIGLSPYFRDVVDLVPALGELPQTTPFYEYYHEQKDRFNCIKIR